MKQSLQLRVSQSLTLTPQLQQSIRLLQLSTVELNQELEKFLLENPLLETEESGSPGSTTAERAERETPASADAPESGEPTAQAEPPADSTPDFFEGGHTAPRGDDEDFEPVGTAEEITLRHHLMAQAGALNLPQRDRALVGIIIDSLNDDGYLTDSMEDIVQLLPDELDVDPDELMVALRHVQTFDPAGVGARSVAECLELQLRAAGETSRVRDVAIGIAHSHLPLLASRDYVKLKRVMQCDEATLREAQALIQSLNPRPGAAYSSTDVRHVTPDVIVRKVRNVWIASLNQDAMPRLRVNQVYASILQGNRNGGSHLSQQLQEARWLIRNVQQRFETIQRVSQAIVDRQRHFFDHGEVAMRPLVLREIADLLGLHESTVSRVTTQKFMATPRGVFELKYFFGSHVSTDSGGACSATAIRALIRQMVSAEDGKHPLSDSKIAEVLGQQGIVVARRTIAKYRESLQIPPVNLRKAL